MESSRMDQHRSHLQPDGSTFPPVTPDPPPPPGYIDPLEGLESDLVGGAPPQEGTAEPAAGDSAIGGDAAGGA
ncbi:hypothetical protein LL946_07460 [Knoellia locipacati]|uniref:hypothetical protein n=1 Tax=Knoellia locipacati TaxID=882824 RepID=UPI00384CC6AD